MILLTLFGLIAGAGTALSPCVLPVLPIALGAGATGGRRRPLGIVVGLTVSFTFATVALVYVLSALGLPDDLLRTIAIAVLLAFGGALLIPPLGARVEAWLSRFAGRAGVAGGGQRDGFWSGTLVGLSLGLVYAPCAGPILAGVITVSASQSFTVGRLAVALSYGIGSALVLYALMLGGRRLTAPLARRSGRLQMAMGAVMVLVALAMLGDYDLRFQSALAKSKSLPAFLIDPAKSLEDTHAARDALASVRGKSHGIGASVNKPQDGDNGDAADATGAPPRQGVPSHLPVIAPAPDFTGTQRWFNTPDGKPLTLKELRGRVVLVDFWTYSCINCLRTLPYLKAWDKRYRDAGLTIVGVHSPEFPFEKNAGNVQAAIAREGLRYPVVQDNELATWNAWGNEYWPAEYFIDAQGRVRFAHAGEGDYDKKENVIRALLAEAGRRVGHGMSGAHGLAPTPGVSTPESYLGAERAARFTNGQIVAGAQDFGSPPKPPQDQLAYGGRWDIGDDHATAAGGASLQVTFGAQHVYLVLGSPGRTRHVRVLLDGRPIPDSLAGADVHGGVVSVGSHRLYDLVSLRADEVHTLRLEPDAGVTGYAFTFG
jgi:cytochrome c biogenesis protein CcdA/thiol-disulfide isomerase/thioredoxin